MYNRDLSGITDITGFKFYSWAPNTKLDNVALEYVIEEETPEEPDTPEFNAEIINENFDGKVLADIAVNDAAAFTALVEKAKAAL